MEFSVDGAIQVLKAEIVSLTRAVDQLGAHLGAKVDVIIAMQVQMGRLQEQSDQNRISIDRAFADIRSNESLSEQTEGKLERAMSFIRGAVYVGAVLFVFAQWYTLDRLDNIKANTLALERMEGSKATTQALNAIDERVSWIEAETDVYERGQGE
jgi:hypothetical protein